MPYSIAHGYAPASFCEEYVRDFTAADAKNAVVARASQREAALAALLAAHTEKIDRQDAYHCFEKHKRRLGASKERLQTKGAYVLCDSQKLVICSQN